LKPAVAQGRQWGRVGRDASEGGTRGGNEEGGVRCNECGVHEDGTGRFQSTGKLQRESRSFEKGLLTPAAMAHMLALTTVYMSHQFI
jgi:hypothetical protein